MCETFIAVTHQESIFQCFVFLSDPSSNECISTGDKEALKEPKNVQLKDMLKNLSLTDIKLQPGMFMLQSRCHNGLVYSHCTPFCHIRNNSMAYLRQLTKLKTNFFYLSGAPCDNFKGYCDVFQKCRSVDADGPLARLKKLLFNKETLMSIKDWIIVRFGINVYQRWHSCIAYRHSIISNTFRMGMQQS